MTLDPNLYKEAAQDIANKKEDFACWSIVHQLDYSPSSLAVTEFTYWFKPYDTVGDTWNTWFGDSFLEENRMARSLALLFMTEIAKDMNNDPR